MSSGLARLHLFIESIHHCANPISHPRLHRVDERGHQLLDDARIRLAELTQDIVRQVAAITARGWRYADAKTGVVLMPERCFDTLEAIVPSGTPARAKAVRA